MSPLYGLLFWAGLGVAGDSPAAALGERLHQAMVSQGQLIELPEAAAWCRSLLPPVAASNLTIHFTHDERPRAFALPGGRIYLSAGAFLALTDSDQLAFVLAHEAAHVHVGERSDQLDPLGKIDIEMQADRDAMAEIQKQGRDPAAARAALQQLATTGELLADAVPADGLERRLAALPAAADPMPSEPLDRSIAPLQVIALTSFLARAVSPFEWQYAEACLTGGCALMVDDATRQRLLAEAWRRAGRAEAAAKSYADLLEHDPDSAELRRGLALSLESMGRGDQALTHWRWLARAGAPDGSLEFAATGPLMTQKHDPSSRILVHRFDGMSLSLAWPWRRIASTRGTLKLSRDGPGIQWLGVRVVDSVMATNPHLAFDQWLAEIRSRMTGQHLALLSASRWGGDGLGAVLEYRDATGLRWRLALFRLGVGGRVVEVEFKAPRLFYFDRDLPAIEAALDTLVASTGEDQDWHHDPNSGHHPEPLLQP
jgi:tetratricopeptide (TPR) repeat protein